VEEIMKHKWHKEIKHLADGGEIEYRTKLGKGIWSDWSVWDEDYFPEFPQAKEPQYLYVWLDKEEDRIEFDHYSVGDVKEDEVYKYIGKIKLEGEEDV